MTDWLGPDPADSTPLDENELVGLVPSWIAGRDDLNQAERENILAALRRADRGDLRPLAAFVRT